MQPQPGPTNITCLTTSDLTRVQVNLTPGKHVIAVQAESKVSKGLSPLIEGHDELNRPYGRIRQGKRANVLRAGDIAPGDVLNIRVLQATAGQLTGSPAA